MNNYPFYNNMYMPEMQMRQPQQSQSTPHIQQTFQLSNPQNNVVDFDGKYAKDIEEVKNNLIFKNTIYIDKEMSTMWVKNINGNIKAYTLTEIVELDEKDKMILNLQKQIEELKGVILNAKRDDENVTETKSTNVPNNKSSNAKQR